MVIKWHAIYFKKKEENYEGQKRKKSVKCSVGTMLLSLAACGNGNEGNAGSSGEKTKSEDQVLSIALGEEPTILDPYQIQDDNAFNVSYAVTEPLFRIAGEDGKDWAPGLATEFEENEELKKLEEHE